MFFRRLTDHTSDHPRYRADIDGLRAVAVLAVMGFHLLPYYFTGGFIGVDVFFVISGYLISFIIFSGLETGTFRFRDFYARRIRRIFPALILVFVACFAASWIGVMLASEFKQLGKYMAAGAGFISNLILWKEWGYFNESALTKPLLHLWSLGIEEQFYIFWPVLLWLGYRLRINFLWLTLAVIGASFAANIVTVGDQSHAAFYAPYSRFWELLLGANLAYFALHSPCPAANTQNRIMMMAGQLLGCASPAHYSQRVANCQSIFGFVLIASVIYFANSKIAFPGWWALIPTIGAYCIIAAGEHAWFNRVVLSNRLMVGIGLISYPLYLWHWSLMSYIFLLTGEFFRSVENNSRIFATSLLLAWLTYRFIEKPFRYGDHQSIKVTILCVLMLLMGCVGYATYHYDGFDFRYPERIRQLTRAETYTDGWRIGKCFLEIKPEGDIFPAECEADKRPSLVLWGDSLAAVLYSGFMNTRDQHGYGIAQYTMSLCPPIIGFIGDPRLGCKDVNDAAFEHIKQSKPDIVLLQAHWKEYDVTALKETIAALKQAGIKRVVVLGIVPLWKGSLPRTLLIHWREIKEIPPLYMQLRSKKQVEKIEQEMAEQLKGQGAEYISIYQKLCNEQGCRTRLAEDSNDIITFDYSHLTPKGAEFLVKMMAKELFRK